MPNVPSLTAAQVAAAVPGAIDVKHIGSGGQKTVFRAILAGCPCALKFAMLPDGIDPEEMDTAEVTIRASREVETMRECTSPHMVRLGTIGLTFVEIEGQKLLYFSEEFVVGGDLRTILAADGPLPPRAIVELGWQITDAIKELWALGKVHRDIKPGNMMRRDDGNFVLLDAGLAFDVVGESLSAGFLVGTPLYFSPEQFDYSSRRNLLDFRSDLFALGVSMYELATGQHPFWQPGTTAASLLSNVKNHDPPAPSTIRPGFPPNLDDIILRMMGKSPHLRYRKCDQLIAALQHV